MAYGDFKGSNKKTVADKVLCDKKFNIDKNAKYDGYHHGLPSIVYKCFDGKTASFVGKSTSGGTVKNEIISNKEVAKELHKPIIRKFEKRKVH